MRAIKTKTESGLLLKTPIKKTACGKLGYATKKLATSAAARQRKATGEVIKAYHCPYGCHAYHIGHPPRWRDHEQ